MLKKKKKERELVKVNLSMGLSALAEMNNVYQIYNSAANNYKTGQNWKTENLGLWSMRERKHGKWALSSSWLSARDHFPI